MTQKQILVVDDIPSNLHLLFRYLKRLDFKVLIAENGEHALKQLGYCHPDLILLDIMMPGVDGFEVCRRLKKNPATADIPVIFMSALTETIDKVTGFEVGGVDYLTKPLQYEEVLARINAHLSLNELRQTLTHKNAALRQQNKELQAFGHTVAHDLKTPVNGLLGSAEALRANLGENLTPRADKYLSFINQTSQKIRHIIDALLLLSESREAEVALTPLDMPSIIDSAIQRLETRINTFNVEITMGQNWPQAIGYAPWIEEVWVNYLSNAIMYGGMPPQLILDAVLDEPHGQVRFQISDNGLGVAPELQEKLFIPFSRIGSQRLPGHGLGLSIVQRIIERCGGNTGMHNRDKGGACFYFTLPSTSLSKG
ncbi:sensor histidine kinase [Candidatus Venteria ishoeyi]|nr:hybrid sensor histidine kinase/response regulator [Candidatus Venteria ishoeyi]MDM8547254.1 hybrid sensor histidine kinase/response regulator [Candidatus Venteria ishoeyi]